MRRGASESKRQLLVGLQAEPAIDDGEVGQLARRGEHRGDGGRPQLGPPAGQWDPGEDPQLGAQLPAQAGQCGAIEPGAGREPARGGQPW